MMRLQSLFRSFWKHTNDIVSEDRITNDDTTGFTEAHINLLGCTCRIMEMLNFTNVIFIIMKINFYV